jgi:hypothetical protein
MFSSMVVISDVFVIGYTHALVAHTDRRSTCDQYARLSFDIRHAVRRVAQTCSLTLLVAGGVAYMYVCVGVRLGHLLTAFLCYTVIV